MRLLVQTFLPGSIDEPPEYPALLVELPNQTLAALVGLVECFEAQTKERPILKEMMFLSPTKSRLLKSGAVLDELLRAMEEDGGEFEFYDDKTWEAYGVDETESLRPIVAQTFFTIGEDYAYWHIIPDAYDDHETHTSFEISSSLFAKKFREGTDASVN